MTMMRWINDMAEVARANGETLQQSLDEEGCGPLFAAILEPSYRQVTTGKREEKGR